MFVDGGQCPDCYLRARDAEDYAVARDHRKVLLHALKAALGAWCPFGATGDGADGETYRLCTEAIRKVEGP